MSKQYTVTVFGSSAISPGDEEYIQAESLGKALAQAGYTVCNGGYTGSMEASAKGASQVGGKVIGVTTDALSERKQGANAYVTEERRQPTLIDRIETLISLADAYVIVQGGIGTLAELFVVWNLVAIGSIPERPIILLGDHYEELMKMLSHLAEIGPKQLKDIKVVSTIEEVMAELEVAFGC